VSARRPPPPECPSTPRIRDRVGIPLAIAGGALAYLLPLRAYGITVSDDGWYLEPVLRMREGAVLYRDVWTFYAPLPHHLFEALFESTGASILAARTLLAVAIAATAALSYRLARRGAPASIAWLPGAVFALVPGPWPKAFLGLCTAAFFVALARALERPLARRFAALGLVAGLTLATRQDLGVAQLAILLVAAPLPALFPRGFNRSAPRSRLYAAFVPAAAGLAAWALVLVPIAAYYASRGHSTTSCERCSSRPRTSPAPSRPHCRSCSASTQAKASASR
jgi:hypothetical protein